MIYLAVVVGMLVQVSSYYVEGYGFTYLVGRGTGTGAGVSWRDKWGADVYNHVGEPGYDAQYYAQLALDPLARDPELARTIDNVPYRVRRILVPWLSYLLGVGQPNAVMQVFSLFNVLCWLALAVLLLRWFPPTDLDRAVRWVGLLYSTGMCLSIYLALADGPSLLLLALALRWFEKDQPWRATAALALGGLAKETSVAAGGLLAPVAWRDLRGWGRALPRVLGVVLPLVVWIGWLRLRLGPAEQPIGARNFDWPLAAVWGRVVELQQSRALGDVVGVYWAASVAGLVSLLTQAGFLLGRWRWREPAWRLAVPFAALALVIGEAVWEGSPGASDRVLLPMLLSFNLLVPVGRKWWAILLLGNLSVFFGPMMLRSVPDSIQHVVVIDMAGAVPSAPESAVEIIFPDPWYAPESHAGESWRWAGGDAEIRVINHLSVPVVATVSGRWASAYERVGIVEFGGQVLWTEPLTKRPNDWRVGAVRLAPGVNSFWIKSDRAPVQLRPESGRAFAVMLLRFRVDGVAGGDGAGN